MDCKNFSRRQCCRVSLLYLRNSCVGKFIEDWAAFFVIPVVGMIILKDVIKENKEMEEVVE